MALVKCKECGGDVSSEAKACPKCGAKPPKRTSMLTWLAAIVIIPSCVLALKGNDGGRPNSYTGSCPPLAAGALWLPADRQQAMPDLERQALLLNKRDQCVLDGSWGNDSQTYYLTVRDVGSTQSRIVRFTPADLAR